MGGKTAIAAGLVMGAVAGGALIGGLVLLAPAPALPPATPVPSVSPIASASAAPSPAASPVGSAVPSSSAPPPSSSPAGASLPPEAELFGVGEPAPALVVPRVGGGEIDLAALRGKPVWVNFMGSYCTPCQDELPLMVGFATRYADQGLQVLAIDVREEEADVAAFMSALGVTFPAGLDADGSAQDAWRALALPVHFWVDREAIVRDGALGGIGPDVMARGLQTILPEVSVTP